MTTDMINIVMKNICLNFYSIIIFFRLSGYDKLSNKKRIIIGISITFLSILYIYIKDNFDIVISSLVIYILLVILLKFITERKIFNIIIGLIISISISYILFTISVVVEFMIQRLLGIKNNIINMFFTLIIEFILIYQIFKIKKIKNGLTFLKKTNDYIEIVTINICIFVIVIYGLLGTNYKRVIEHLVFYYIILGICMIITIQKILVMYYKQKLIDDTINQYKQDLQEKDNEIKRLTDEAFRVSKINHEFYNRQKSLELMVKEKLQNFNMETGEDFDILTRIQNLTSEHAEKVKEIKSLPALQLTNIPEIDDMFTYMQKECSKNGIQFKLNINGNIHSLINNFIPKDKLETLIGDHIRDAIIAINSGDNENKEILVILGIRDNCYELCIYDTGIEFEIKTLLNLGLAPITTHKDTGGSGIGFMTTFETLNECNASLIIEERHPVNDKDYTKAVKVRFDKKNEYRIYSYRAHEINKMNNNKRLIVCKEYQ